MKDLAHLFPEEMPREVIFLPLIQCAETLLQESQLSLTATWAPSITTPAILQAGSTCLVDLSVSKLLSGQAAIRNVQFFSWLLVVRKNKLNIHIQPQVLVLLYLKPRVRHDWACTHSTAYLTGRSVSCEEECYVALIFKVSWINQSQSNEVVN